MRPPSSSLFSVKTAPLAPPEGEWLPLLLLPWARCPAQISRHMGDLSRAAEMLGIWETVFVLGGIYL